MTASVNVRSSALDRVTREDLPVLASKVHCWCAMELTTYRVRPLVTGWKVEADGANLAPTMRETKADAMHTAYSLAHGTLHEIVVLDKDGKVESVFPPRNDEMDGA